MTGHGQKFGRKKEQAIAALLACSSLPAAAASCGISERTLRRWLRDELFARHYRQERNRMLENTVTLLRHKSAAAVGTLEDVANDKASPAGARVSAARAIVELSKGTELQDLEARIDELEQMAKERFP